MKIAYIILAHKRPRQLARLVKRLSTKDSYFSIHIDARIDQEDFVNEIKTANILGPQVHFQEKRYSTRWGGFNAVRATAELIESVLPLQPDNIMFLSGQDYPLMNNNEIRDFLRQYEGKAIIEHRLFHLNSNQPNRVNRYYFYDYFDREKASLIPRFLTKVLPSRTPPKEMKIYIGRAQFVMPYKIAKYVVSEYKSNKRLNDFFKYALCVDELYFQTLLMNSSFSDQVIHYRTHFADYSQSHPPILRTKDLEKLKKKNKLFARKFDVAIDENVLDLLDDFIDKKQTE